MLAWSRPTARNSLLEALKLYAFPTILLWEEKTVSMCLQVTLVTTDGPVVTF